MKGLIEFNGNESDNIQDNGKDAHPCKGRRDVFVKNDRA